MRASSSLPKKSGSQFMSGVNGLFGFWRLRHSTLRGGTLEVERSAFLAAAEPERAVQDNPARVGFVAVFGNANPGA